VTLGELSDPVFGDVRADPQKLDFPIVFAAVAIAADFAAYTGLARTLASCRSAVARGKIRGRLDFLLLLFLGRLGLEGRQPSLNVSKP
jgi:hypothetical protein